MIYRNYKLALLARVTILFITLLLLAFIINGYRESTNLSITIVIIISLLLGVILSVRSLFKLSLRRFIEMDDFFESVKYRDFSRWYAEDHGPQDLMELHRKFNIVNETFKIISKEKETQHFYLQKILELVNTGIVAYSTETGKVLWINESFKKTLNIPSLKNISFVEKRKPKLYTAIFETNHVNGNTISIETENSKIKILISTSLFSMEKDAFKLIVLQNIDDTLNQNESEAWKKLLSVMTHEIMNSIAPISSLAETIHSKIRLSLESPKENQLEINDLQISIESIRKRSEGLMKFARTYRGLNKITKLNPSIVLISDLFNNISNLLQPSLESKNINLEFEVESPKLRIEIDSYLIEQVLINLILNAIDACKNIEAPKIIISADQNIEGYSLIKIIDNGTGIPDEFIDKIFIPFFSTKKNGSGIGLSLCKQIMLLHKGTIRVKSVEEKGTEISLIFSNELLNKN